MATRLMKAIKDKDEQALRRALKSARLGQDLDSIASLNAALIEAARGKSESCVMALLEAGASPEAQDAKGQSALQWAAFSGAEACVRALIQAGADVERPLPNGFSRPLHTALRSRSLATIEALLAAGAKALDPDGSSSARRSVGDLRSAALTRQDQGAADFARAAEALLERAELAELSAPGAPRPRPFL